MSSTPYLMEDAREVQRLALKVDAGAWVERYLPSLPSHARRVLDVGCGAGVIAEQIARSNPAARVVGLDVSRGRLRSARTAIRSVTFQQGEAARQPFCEGAFDVVYSRFMLEYLPERARCVQEMVRVCRPGGRVILQDLDGQLLWHHPIASDFDGRLQRVLRGLEGRGFDPFVGRKLFALARDAGLRNVTVVAEPYHFIAGAADAHTLGLWELKLDIALPVIAETLGDVAQARQFKADFLAHLASDDTLTYSVVFTVTGEAPVA